MKISLKILLFSIMVLPSLLFFSACGETNSEKSNELQSISVSEITTEFNVGDDFTVNANGKVTITTKGGDVFEYTTDGLVDNGNGVLTAVEYTIDYSAYVKNTPGIYDIVIKSITKPDVTYTVKVTVKANDNAWVAQPNITGWIYGTPNTPTGSAKYGEITYEYKLKNADDSTYSTTKPANIGSYTMRAKVDVTTYHPAIAPVTVDFSIAKLSITKPTQTSEVLTFNGQEQTFKINDIDNTYMNIIGDLKKVNAGTTVITISLKDSLNTQWTDSSTDDVKINFVINKAKLNKVSADLTAFVYNGSEQSYSPVGFNGNFMSITGNKMTNAGEQTVTIKFKDENINNCEWSDGTNTDITFNFNIARLSVTKPTQLNNAFIFNGQEQTYEIKGIDNTYMNVTGDLKKVNAGKTTITISLKDKTNLQWKDTTTNDITFNFEILKFSMKKPFITTEDLVYNGKVQSLEFGDYNKLHMTTTGILNKTNAGTSEVKISLNDKINTEWADKTTDDLTYNFIIEKAKVEEVYADTTDFQYNGKEQIYTPSGFDNDFMTITGHKMKNPGTQTVIVKLKNEGNANCTWSDGSTTNLTFTFKIKASYIAKPSTIGMLMGWSGNEQTYIPEGFDPNTMVISNNSITDIGSQEITISLKNPEYCIWDDETTADITISLAMIKGVIVNPKEDPSIFIYNGEEQVYNVLTEYPNAIVVTNNKRTDAGTQQVTVALKDTTKATWADNTTDDLTFDFTIYNSLDEKYGNIKPEASDLKVSASDLNNIVSIFNYLHEMDDEDEILDDQFSYLKKLKKLGINFELLYEFYGIDTTNASNAAAALAAKIGMTEIDSVTEDKISDYWLAKYEVTDLYNFFYGSNCHLKQLEFAQANNYTAEEISTQEKYLERMGLTIYDIYEKDYVIQNNRLIKIESMAIPVTYYEQFIKVIKFYGITSDKLEAINKAFVNLSETLTTFITNIAYGVTQDVPAFEIDKTRTVLTNFIRTVGLDFLIVGSNPGIIETFEMFANIDNISLSEYMNHVGYMTLKYRYVEDNKVVYYDAPKSETDLGTIVYGATLYNAKTDKLEFIEGICSYEIYDITNTLNNKSTQDEINELFSIKANYIRGQINYTKELKTYQFYKDNDMNALLAKTFLIIEDLLVSAINTVSVDNLSEIANTVLNLMGSKVKYSSVEEDLIKVEEVTKAQAVITDYNSLSEKLFNAIQIINSYIQNMGGIDLIYNELYTDWKPLLESNVRVHYDPDDFDNFARSINEDETEAEYRAYLDKCIAFYDIMENYLYTDMIDILIEKIINSFFEASLEDTNNTIACFKEIINLLTTVDKDGLLNIIKTLFNANSATEEVDPILQTFTIIDKVINNVSENSQETIQSAFNQLVDIINESIEEYYIINWEDKYSDEFVKNMMQSYDGYFGSMTFTEFKTWINDVANGRKSFNKDSLISNLVSLCNNYFSDLALITIFQEIGA